MSSTQRSQINRGMPREVHCLVQTGAGSGWLVVGRDDEVRRGLAAREEDAKFHGVVLTGAISANIWLPIDILYDSFLPLYVCGPNTRPALNRLGTGLRSIGSRACTRSRP